VQRVIGGLNDRLDDDRDGNALDDVGRDAVGVAKRGGAAVAKAAKQVTANPKVRETAGKAVTASKEVAGKVRDRAKKRWKKWFG
jgi:hypothetical protein